MTDQIYALYYEWEDQRRYFYVGRSCDPARRHTEHKSNANNKKHKEDVYEYIRDQLQPNGIDIWDMEVLVSEPNARAEDCEDFWVVLMIRAGHNLKNMKHGDVHRVHLALLARNRLDLNFTTVEEFVEFRETVDREQREAYERSERLKKSVLGEEPGDPVLLEMIRNTTDRFRESNADRMKKQLKREERARAAALEREEWLKQMRLVANRGADDETGR
jgi:hypothetical protein